MKVFYFHSFSSSHLLAYFLLLRSQKENLTVLLCFYFFDVIVFLHFPFSDTYNYFKDAGCKKISFCSIRFFFHGHWRLTVQQGKGGDHVLFHFTTSTSSQTFRYLFATLHVRWLSPIFNHTACIYQTATQWDLPPYQITIWLIDDARLSVCLFTWWFDSSFFVTAIWNRKQVDSNLHRLSPLYYKQTD